MTLGILLILVVVIVLGEPLYVLIGAIAAYLLLASGEVPTWEGLTTIVELTRKLSDNEILLAIPFFVLSGAIMSEGDIARRLIRVANAIFARVPGGLAISAVAACAFFAAISGSSPVTVIAIGSIMYPALVKERYSERFSSGLVTTAGSLGILIPPSIPMLIYAIVDPMELEDPANYEIARAGQGLGVTELFIAGIGPGLFIAALLGGYSLIYGVRLGVTAKAFDMAELRNAISDGFWALMLPVIILGGIYSGQFTPTQAAAVSVVYAVVVELWIHRSLTLRDLPRVLSDSTVLIGSLLIIMALAQGLNKYFELAGVAEAAVEWLTEMELSAAAFLLFVNVLLLVVGMFMDILSAILILVPLLSPIGYSLGIHPIHLAIVFIVNLEIGYMTPPVGLNLFVGSTIFKKSIGEMVRAVLPFVGVMLIGLIAITYVPTITLGPLSALNGNSFVVGFPERRIPMRELHVRESLDFLSGLAEAEEEEPADGAAEAAPPARDPGRPLTMAELMAQNQANLEQQALSEGEYSGTGEMLAHFRLVHTRRVRLRDLSLVRDGTLQVEYVPPGAEIVGTDEGAADGSDSADPGEASGEAATEPEGSGVSP
jgi:C4-dicarboxylate transporter DctM subunit